MVRTKCFVWAIGICFHAILRGLGIPMACLWYGQRHNCHHRLHQVLVVKDEYQVFLWLEVSEWKLGKGFHYHFQPAWPVCGALEFGHDTFETRFWHLVRDLEWAYVKA